MTKALHFLLATLIAISLTNIKSSQANGDIVLGIGHFDILDNEDSVALRGEYRFNTSFKYNIKPLIGFETSTDKAIHGLLGFYRDFSIAEDWEITPSLAGGPYANGSGPDLDHYIQFRSMLELGYRYDDKHKVSLGFSHTSNGNLGDSNPGTETAILYYHLSSP